MRAKMTIALLVLATGFSASAELVINEWNVDDTDKWVEYLEGSIRILESDPDTFCFEAYDSVTGLAANINVIKTDSGGVAGTVLVTVAPDPGSARVYGAADVGEIDLSSAGTGNIVDLDISGSLATDGDVVCDNITGDIDIGGNMATGGDVDCDNLVGNITVAGTHGDGPGSTTYRLHADAGTGNISIAGDCLGNLELGTYHTGEITIGGLLLGDLDAGNPHDVTIQGVGTHEGNISITGDVYYTHDLAIGDSGNQTSEMTGDIYINHGTHGHGGDTGWIRIYGDMHGSSRLFGLC